MFERERERERERAGSVGEIWGSAMWGRDGGVGEAWRKIESERGVMESDSGKFGNIVEGYST